MRVSPKTVIQWLDGKKTVIGFALCALADIITGILIDVWHIEGFRLVEIAATANKIGWALGGVGLGHKTWKTLTAAAGPGPDDPPIGESDDDGGDDDTTLSSGPTPHGTIS